VAAPITFQAADLPSAVGLPLSPNGVVSAINLYWVFQTMFVVHTTDTDVPAPNSASSKMKATYGGGTLNKNDYTIVEQAGWQFNGTGEFDGSGVGVAGNWSGGPVRSTNGVTTVLPGVSIVQGFLPPATVGEKLNAAVFTTNGRAKNKLTLNMQMNAQQPLPLR
jgi:hypothetical protein